MARAVDPEMLEKAVRLYLLGYSTYVITERTGVSNLIVLAEIKRRGIPVRDRGQVGRKNAALLRQVIEEASEEKKRTGEVPTSLRRPKALRDVDMSEYRRRYESGERTQELADELGVDRATMKYLLRKLGTKMRPKGTPPGWTSPNHRNVVKTHCPQGHEYTPENTRHYTYKNGRKNRFCRACNIAAVKRNRERKKKERRDQ